MESITFRCSEIAVIIVKLSDGFIDFVIIIHDVYAFVNGKFKREKMINLLFNNLTRFPYRAILF